MTNQTFCYWLQGYFEISQQVALTKEKIQLIHAKLSQIVEPLCGYTQWLKNLFLYLQIQNHRQSLLDYFLVDMRDHLNLVFYHVIDNSYNTDISHNTLKHIHDGNSVNDK